MTPNHPIPPERIRAEAERVVNEFAAKNTRMAAFDSMVWDDRCRERFLALVAAGASLVDVSAVQREAASKAYGDAWMDCLTLHANRDEARDRYLASTYPAPVPAPRECVLLSNGERVEYDGKVRYRGYTWDTVAGFLQRDNERGYALTMDELRQVIALAERAK